MFFKFFWRRTRSLLLLLLLFSYLFYFERSFLICVCYVQSSSEIYMNYLLIILLLGSSFHYSFYENMIKLRLLREIRISDYSVRHLSIKYYQRLFKNYVDKEFPDLPQVILLNSRVSLAKLQLEWLLRRRFSRNFRWTNLAASGFFK